ncbi:ankyrin repeat domain-containing protein [Nostoc sp. FACHB-190]|uniref:ankyrin repeat domain-containing protein n=1 Tax=Nostoc sp. FACHB-190 TaxID=2692838 RepID=UPI001683E206|nr:ankyrin repeat domain-containing protein [Nostoc sp. FACHB-190]MBD2302885.1 ankyrin repeat domain-containing protein [Nostoc sp. FACHB-190]
MTELNFAGKELIYAIQQDDTKQAIDIVHQVSFPQGSYYLNLALTRATSKGNYLASVALVEAGSDINGVNDSIPLINAVLSKQYELIKFLLKNGADTERKDENSYTALMYAVSHQDLEAIILLIEAGASCETETFDGLTAKSIAEMQNNPKILEYFRKH